MRVSVIGLGKTGLPIAVALLKKGHSVVGIEISKARVSQIRDHGWSGDEPGCDWRARRDIEFTGQVEQTDLTILMVNTPETSTGDMDLGPVKEAAWRLGEELRGKYHTLVVSATVMPGTCKEVIQPLVGPNCKVVFSPVWLALGSVVEDYLHPPVAVAGCDEELNFEEEEFFKTLFGKEPLQTDTKTAEALKLVYNEWCTLKMVFTTRMAQIFANIGADPKTVEPFFKQGGEQPGKFLRPGPPFGGPCFPRDVRFAEALALRAGFANESLVQAIQRINDAGYSLILRQVDTLFRRGRRKDKVVGIAGLTYKAGVPVLEESSSLALITRLSAAGWGIAVYDPAYVDVDALGRDYAKEFTLVGDVDTLGRSCDVVVEMHQGLVPEEFKVPVIRLWV